jgi:hypothetical protein
VRPLLGYMYGRDGRAREIGVYSAAKAERATAVPAVATVAARAAPPMKRRRWRLVGGCVLMVSMSFGGVAGAVIAGNRRAAGWGDVTTCHQCVPVDMGQPVGVARLQSIGLCA